MPVIKPFKALRPKPELATKVGIKRKEQIKE